MAAAQLNFNEETLDHTSGLYDLYSRFYQGMRDANAVDAPDFTQNPPTTPTGGIDNAAIATQLAAYSDILMKNSAYMMANAIMTTVSGGGSGGTAGVGFLSRHGDSMAGALGALYGFEAGYNNNVIFDVSILSDNTTKQAHVRGVLLVDSDASVGGKLTLANAGIYFGAAQTIYIGSNGHLNLNNANVDVSGNLKVGQMLIDGANISVGTTIFYNSLNSNNATTDWSMRDGHAYGDFTVDGDLVLNGTVDLLHGFKLGEFGQEMFYSVKDDETNEIAHINLESDIHIIDGYAIKFLNKPIIQVRENAIQNTVSFSAPGMVLNLGDSYIDVVGHTITPTQRIALQTDIYNATSDFRMVSSDGAGNFPNGFSAGCANAGSTVLQTYITSANDNGVVFPKNIRLGTTSGPIINTDNTRKILTFIVPYTHVESVPTNEMLGVYLKYEQTSSLFRDLSKAWSASLHLSTQGEFFIFEQPVEASSFSIISSTYKTRLVENALMFADGVFLEGITGGILHQGNATFSASLSSPRFASGFAGYGWAIMEGSLYGGIAATFDELTIRKKVRIYELEVQKINITNGSLWVSDACSGDLVEEIL